MDTPTAEPLTRRDLIGLAVVTAVICALPIFWGYGLSGHESVLPQNSREMLADHDWLVPKVGGEPWLERPPVPDWLIAGVYAICGTSANDRVARTVPLLVAVPVVLAIAWLASTWFGRYLGLLTGGVLATMFEFWTYASDPEADMFLCGIVTLALVLFARLEFGPAQTEGTGFFGRRSWLLLAFFVALGATNLAKGLIFGTLMVLVPIAGYLLSQRQWSAVARYVWAWGWLAAGVVALAWPVAVIVRHPDIRDLWLQHYLGRLHGTYIAEPLWYYLNALPYVTAPWGIAAIVGLATTARKAWNSPRSPERFLWCWALLVPAFFSIPTGKHHHYLLHCLAPWAILGAVGTAKMWAFVQTWPALYRHPAWAAILGGIVANSVLLALAHRVTGPAWVVPTLLIIIPQLIGLAAYAFTRSNPVRAAGWGMAVLALGYCLLTGYKVTCLDDYADDRQFLRTVVAERPTAPLFVQYDWRAPLETFWVLYHTPMPLPIVRDAADLAHQMAGGTEAYVLARLMDAPNLSTAGGIEVIGVSAFTRAERAPVERRALFRIKLLPDALERAVPTPLAPPRGRPLW